MQVALCGFSSVGLVAVLAAVGCSPRPGPASATTEAPAQKPPPAIELSEKPAFPLEKHLEAKDIAAGTISYAQLFEDGRKLFDTPFNGLDGVGMKRTVGGTPLTRFSVGPAGGGQPTPVGAQACGSCHGQPIAGGYGLAHTRVIFDAPGKGTAPFAPRATTSLFGNGVLQLLAQEMTEQLLAARDAAAEEAKGKPGTAVRRDLRANGVDFGAIIATAKPNGEVAFDTSQVRGVLPDLVIRPFGWKGNITTVRNFVVAAGTFGMGMQAEEFVWRLGEKAGTDPDADGVTRELSVGDVTAMTIFNAALPVPSEANHLADLGLVTAPDEAAKTRIENGRQLFAKAGCTSCHIPEMRLNKPVYEEPTLAGGGNYLDKFLAGKDADYDPKRPVRVDMMKEAQEPRLEAASEGGAIVRLYGDLKRHDMGRTFADPVPQGALDSTLTPVQHNGKVALLSLTEFLTAELWGVGSTGPWLHDDRAGTIDEAILLHGEDSPPAAGQPGRSEAQEARDAYKNLTPEERSAIVTFLKSLVTVPKERTVPTT